ncbi:SRPBCC domain-containing protein [Formosa sp. S-31]|uniref:SRPBCC domain-containing protein n=1 Tax=Formosa sp. S-31 TaxID=2790949 RepID=UPI003EC0FEBA
MEKITIQSLISGDKKNIWNYYTAPEHIINWNFASPDWCCPYAENDLKIGGTYKARMEAKDGSQGFDFICTYRKLIPEESFCYVMENSREVTVDFHRVDKQTQVTITFDPETEHDLELQRQGWQAILNNFKSYAEQQQQQQQQQQQ